jgi:hypothetical protein
MHVNVLAPEGAGKNGLIGNSGEVIIGWGKLKYSERTLPLFHFDHNISYGSLPVKVTPIHHLLV